VDAHWTDAAGLIHLAILSCSPPCGHVPMRLVQDLGYARPRGPRVVRWPLEKPLRRSRAVCATPMRATVDLANRDEPGRVLAYAPWRNPPPPRKPESSYFRSC